MTIRPALVLAPALLVFAGHAVLAAPAPEELLGRMAWALERTNYEGVFIHTHLGRSETLKVIHRVDAEGRVTERLVSIDGSGREIIRNEDEVRCILPDRRSVFVERRNKQNPLFANLPTYSDELTLYYELQASPPEKLLRLDTDVLIVAPRDGYRYGYKLWLERATSLPLKTQLIGEDGGVIEQILFHSITLSEEIPAAAVRPGVDASGFKWYYEGEETDAEQEPGGETWQAATLPPGFRLRTSTMDLSPDSSDPTLHVVYSDGLASVSVFVEPGAARRGELMPGLARMGAAFAFTQRHDDRYVTAVGEVPEITVRMIAGSMRPLRREAQR